MDLFTDKHVHVDNCKNLGLLQFRECMKYLKTNIENKLNYEKEAVMLCL
jgi:hypothetical protein